MKSPFVDGGEADNPEAEGHPHGVQGTGLLVSPWD